MDRSKLLYQFDFARVIAINSEENGYQEPLDDLSTVSFRVDAIDPADPNTKSPGPDGSVEIGGDWEVEAQD